MKPSHKTILLWILLIGMFVLIYNLMKGSPSSAKKVPFSEFMSDVNERPQIFAKVKIRGSEIKGKYKADAGGDKNNREFKTFGIVSWQLTEKLDKGRIKYSVEEKEESIWPTLLISWLPMLVLFLIFFFVIRQLQTGGGKAMSFGKSKARLLNEQQNKVTFKDVAGIEEAKEEVEEIIAFLKDPKKFTRLGGRIPKGVLLMGPPGTGKTLLARAIAGEAGVPFFSISGSDFVEMFVGVGASRVRDLFEQGKKHAPCIIFIDEIDAVGRHRGAGLGGGHDEREQTLNQLLVEMDGFESNEGVILIAATNRPDVLDPALLRPGRFDRRIIVPRPDIRGREGILDVHANKTPLGPDVELETIARGTPGFSGADLENLVNEAALHAARNDKSFVEMDDFEGAKDKVIMGTERRSMIISDHDKKITAYHEAGHALVARMIPGEKDPVHKVTIIPRGPALGATVQLPEEDRLNFTKTFANNTISILMGGRLAEELVFDGQQTTGASNDLEKSTEFARKMVCEWGMSKNIGPLTFGKKEEAIFLGREVAQHQDYSEKTAREIDAEVKRIVVENYDRSKKLLQDNIEVLHRLAKALLEYESLDGAEVEALVKGGSIKREVTSKASGETSKDRAEDEESVTGSILTPQPVGENS